MKTVYRAMMGNMPRWRTLLFVAMFAACSDSTRPKGPADIAYAGGNGQSGVAGVARGVTPKVKVLDGDGGGLAGVAVTWTVTAGGGSVASNLSTTGDDGTAQPGSWTLGGTAGTNALSVSVAGVEKTLTFLATGVPGPPAAVVVQGGANQSTAAGSQLPIAPSVRVVDGHANAVSGVTVTFEVTGGGGSVAGTTATTNVNGIASAGKWTLGPASGVNTLSASVDGLPPAIITATATAPPTQLVINTEPEGVIDGEVFDIQPVISIRDAANGVVTSSAATVTASIASGTGTLSGTTTVAATNGIAAFVNLAVSGNSAVTLRFTSTNLTDAISAPFTPAPPPPLNLTVDRVHLNQGAQTYDGTVPIVAGRAALARVFVKANVTNTSLPSVRLQTFVNGSPFKTYTIPAPASPTRLIDESVLTRSWNVLIPANEVVEGMSVLADVDPAGEVTESSEADNSYPASGTPLSLDVRQVSTMKATFVPVSQPGVAAGNITEANKMAAVEYAMRVYPFDTVVVQVHAPYAYSGTLSGTAYDNSWSTLLSQMRMMRLAEGTPERYYYGLVHPAYTSGGTGYGTIGEPQAIGMDFTNTVLPATDYYRMTIAHEWGHNFGRNHIACGNPTGTDSNFPYDPLTTIGTNGFDNIQGGVIRKATDMRELMSYCQPVWTSDYTYKAVLDFRATHPAPPVSASRKVLLVWGRIGPDGVVLEPSYEIEAPVSLPRESGPYTVQALDDAGRPLFTVSFAGAEVDHAPGVRTFGYAIPLPASGARPATVRMLDGMREVARRSRAIGTAGGATTNAVPAATRLTQVGAGRARLEWDARVYPGAMVRDPATGQVLAFLSGGSGEIAVARDVDVVFSTGVTSVKQRVVIVPR
jgi:hypothetical protein